MTSDREALDALLDRVFPRVEPAVKRSYALYGDDAGVDARDDQRRAVDEFIDALVDDPTLEVSAVPTPEEDQGPAASCAYCVGAGGYEDHDGAWIECSCQRDTLEERARALAMSRLFAEIEKAKGKVVLIGTVAEHLRRAHDDIRRAEEVLAETEAAVKARTREGQQKRLFDRYHGRDD